MYKILDTKNNRSFKPELIGSTLEGEKMGEYIKINDILFLSEEVQEIAATQRQKTNKTAVINSIQIYKQDRSIPEIKEIMEIKSKLRKKTSDDIQGITYFYKEIIDLYFLSSKQRLSNTYRLELKQAVKLIIESNINIDSYGYNEILTWYEMGIL